MAQHSDTHGRQRLGDVVRVGAPVVVAQDGIDAQRRVQTPQDLRAFLDSVGAASAQVEYPGAGYVIASEHDDVRPRRLHSLDGRADLSLAGVWPEVQVADLGHAQPIELRA